jgi:surfeit locus 1 family protein
LRTDAIEDQSQSIIRFAKFLSVKKRDLAFAVLGVLFALVCIRLGVWQLQRLGERRHLNAELLSRAQTKPIELSQLPKDTGKAHFARVKLSGTYDYAHEIVLTNRTREGSPGVNIITPLKWANDTAVLVNRGWVYAPDGMTVDLARWREPPSMTGEGFVEEYHGGKGQSKSPTHPNAYRWLDGETAAQAFPYPVEPYFVVLIGDSGKTPENVPPRVDVPPLDEGPHKSYAIQWFSFAAISIFGTILYLRRK